jgi:hypothetical protein
VGAVGPEHLNMLSPNPEQLPLLTINTGDLPSTSTSSRTFHTLQPTSVNPFASLTHTISRASTSRAPTSGPSTSRATAAPPPSFQPSSPDWMPSPYTPCS